MRRTVCVLTALIIAFSSLALTASAKSSAAMSLCSSNIASSGKIALTWTAVKDAAKYEVYRAESKNGQYARVFTTAKLEMRSEKISPGRTYYFYVKAISADGTLLVKSATVYRTCDCAAPVVSSSTVAKTGKIQLKWQKVEGASKYEVYRSPTRNGTYSKMFTTANLSYINTGANAGYTYYYKVKAISADTPYADSAFSNIAYRTCDCPMLSSVSAEWTKNGSISFKWSRVTGATGYKIYRADTKDGEYKLLAKTSSPDYTDTSAVAGSYYHYRFVACNSHSTAADSAPLYTVAGAAPGAPKNVRLASMSGGEYRLSWDRQKSADGYLIFIGKTAKPEDMELLRSMAADAGNATVSQNGDYRYFSICAYANLSNGNTVLSQASETVRIK